MFWKDVPTVAQMTIQFLLMLLAPEFSLTIDDWWERFPIRGHD
jgi:hypothetical protein